MSAISMLSTITTCKQWLDILTENNITYVCLYMYVYDCIMLLNINLYGWRWTSSNKASHFLIALPWYGLACHIDCKSCCEWPEILTFITQCKINALLDENLYMIKIAHMNLSWRSLQLNRHTVSYCQNFFDWTKSKWL